MRRQLQIAAGGGNRFIPSGLGRLGWTLLLITFALAGALAPSIKPVHAAGVPPHVMVVVMENHSYESVIGNSQMPFINSLLATEASLSLTDLSHPSLPNYLGLISGSIANNPQDTTPQDKTYSGPQLTDELAASGISWKAYLEDMPRACDLTDQYGPGHYDVNHNPFMYFDSVRANPAQCNRDVPYTQLAVDLSAGAAPSFIWVSPNTVHDMHDGTDAQGDAFLRDLVGVVRGSSWWTAGSRIVVTWDEGESTENVLSLVIGSARHTTAAGGSEYAILRGLAEAYGVSLPGHSADANVGDILPLLAGGDAVPSAASPLATASPVTTPSAVPTPVRPAGLPFYVRGAYGRDSSPTGLANIAASGFNTVMADPFKELLSPLPADGLKAIVWLGAWLNAPTCNFERGDDTVRSEVTPIAGNPAILAYYLGDEPKVTECPNAPAMFKQRSDLVHTLDPGSTTFTVIQAFENGVANDYTPWRGTVDTIGFDVYPCAKASSTCTLGDIDTAVAAIHKAGIDRYWAVVQDFQDCYYRFPSAQDLAEQFDHWARSDMSGYLVFSWNYMPAAASCQGTTLDQHPDNVTQLRLENARTFVPQPAGTPAHPQTVTTGLEAAIPGGAAPLVGAGVALAVAVLVVLLLIARRRRGRLAREASEQAPVGTGEVDLVSRRGDIDDPG